ncbi:gliding motility-associated C-terminal domain-containing protein [Larkinella terrae]|nr:gliding motility-associated C-terminal domain-containing protein [Larkinella terrae]
MFSCIKHFRINQPTGRKTIAIPVLISCFLVIQCPCFAQSCNRLAAEINTNQTFGTNGITTLLPEQIPYTYVTDGCPNDGQYAVRSSVDKTCYTSSWHGLAEDHTPDDVNGNMLVINPPYKGSFYQQTITGLCSGTTYELSMWVVNLNLIMPDGTCGLEVPHDPDITMQIETSDGESIQTGKTGTIPRTRSPIWVRYAVLFTVPANTDQLIIRLINNELGGCGNDFALDDIQIKQCSSCRLSRIDVPDSFSPNNDGTNDLLDIYYTEVIAAKLIIYNRWGNAIFSSTDRETKWNGTYLENPCETGVYAWIIKYTIQDENNQAIEYTKRGQVLLFR